MYRKAVLAILTGTFLTGFVHYRHANFEGGGDGQSIVVASSKDVTSDVTKKIESLPAELARMKSPEEKVKHIRQTIEWAQALRKASGVQSLSREVSLDFMLEPLQEFSASSYRADNCPYFKAYINSQYEPSEDGEVTHPSLRRAQRVIASVCP